MIQRQMPALMEALYGEDPQQPGRYYLRVMLRARERQPSEQKKSIIDQVTAIAAEAFPPEAGPGCAAFYSLR